MVRSSLVLLLLLAAAARGELERVEGVPVASPRHEAVMARAGRLGDLAPTFSGLSHLPGLGVEADEFAGMATEQAVSADDGLPVADALAKERGVAGGVSTVEPLACSADHLRALLPSLYAVLPASAGIGRDTPELLPLPAGASVTPDLLGYEGLSGVPTLLLDRLLAPMDIWRYGPLGTLSAAANDAAERGDQETFDELSARFWALYEAAAARRAALGDGNRERE